jgi:16S rRNA (uracil1498-N3)-methyltransferase
MIRDFTSTRLFVHEALSEGAVVDLDSRQSNYLVNVLRMKDGDEVLIFNGADGEWRAKLSEQRRHTSLLATEQTRPQTPPPDLHYLFAPLKHARLDYMVEKAVEMGAGRLRPVLTRHTQVHRVNLDRMRANAIEAAEQCGILTIPEIDEPVPLLSLLDRWENEDPTRHLIFCDESAEGDALMQLGALASAPATTSPLPTGERDRVREVAPAQTGGRLAVLIGPEGGFAEDERTALLSRKFVTPISLGPRILRADTAAIAALAIAQATLGDWR